MPKCTRKGCGKDFDEGDNAEGSCSYHAGGPVFHEGLKSWSCCADVNKPVMEFDAFMAIPACATGTHTSAAPVSAASTTGSKPSEPNHVTVENGVETYSMGSGGNAGPSSAATSTAPIKMDAPAPEPEIEEEDDASLPVPEGSRCKRRACGATWEGEDVSRGEGEKAKCRYHPMGPVFHEGTKYNACCPRRKVLEFDEFMKIEGCKEGSHLFVGAKKDENKEEMVNCRMDHYQTPMQIHVSAFAKGADKEKSKIVFETQQISLDLYLPANKRVKKVVTLYGPIDPGTSTFRILGTKVEMILQKPGPASWPLLELPPPGSELPPGYALTFGVSGRTGTVGGKEIVLAAEEVGRREGDSRKCERDKDQ